jgi:tRNA1Val (adenine37-N6)-methyltransferase
MFQFKQFSVDQSGCAMRINTDGVLLGALALADKPQNILDIGTGTGVIALMLAQRYPLAKVDAVEIDEAAAQTAERNFKKAPFAARLALFPVSFEHYFNEYHAKQYDLIVSNPPFHLNSLESPQAKKSLAKHTDNVFFERLIEGIAGHLTPTGLCWLVLPLPAAELVKELATRNKLGLQKTIAVHSFETDMPHREIVCFGFKNISVEISNLVIYKTAGEYSSRYKQLLQPYFIAF